jgi:2'-5' RNA ligase
MRLFTAIDIPEEVKAALGALIARLRPLANLRWSPVDHLHVTTKFIGEWTEGRLGELTSALAAVPAGGGIDIAIRGLGWFPNPHHPRVFWAGVESGEPLRALAQATDQTLTRMGVAAEDRDFHPHLTLARTKERVPLDALRGAVALEATQDFGSFHATSFFLYLSAAGKYTKQERFPLSNT